MKIAIQPPFPGPGRGTMAESVVPGWLDALAEVDRETQYLTVGIAFREAARRREQIYLPKGPNFSRDLIRLPELAIDVADRAFGVDLIGAALRRRGVGLLHQIEPFGVGPSKFPTIQTIYDLIPEKFPEWMPASYESTRRRRRDNARRAVHLIAVSEWTKKDAVREWGIDPDRISVIYLGIDHSQFQRIENPGEIADVRRRYGLSGRFIMSTGEFGPKRSHETLIEAFAALRLEFPDLNLILIGRDQEYRRSLQVLSERLRVPVVFPGTIPRRDLVLLYSAASMLSFAGRYEGFGLPLLEAMATGCPIISSTSSVFPEALGDAGVLVENGNVADLQSAIRALLMNSHQAEAIRQKGYIRVAAFTWKRTAEMTVELYRREFSRMAASKFGTG